MMAINSVLEAVAIPFLPKSAAIRPACLSRSLLAIVAYPSGYGTHNVCITRILLSVVDLSSTCSARNA